MGLAEPIRIWMVIGQFHPIVGGAEIQAQHLSFALQQLGIVLRVVTLRYGLSPASELIDNVPVRRLAAPHVSWKQERYFPFYTSLLAFGLYLYRHRAEYDLLHAHQMLGPAAAALWAGRRAGTPVLAKVGSSGYRLDPLMLASHGPLGWRLAGLLKKDLSAAVATSVPMLRDLEAWGMPPERLYMIPNGVTPARLVSQETLRGLRQEMGACTDTHVICYVGSLRPVKGLTTLLSAMPNVLQERANTQLWLVGDGPERTSLEGQVREAGLADHVRFIGQVSDVSPYLQASNSFVLPSKMEGLSNALLEAMQAGLPCVATDVGGNRQLISHGKSGWLVPPDEADSLAQTLSYVASHPVEAEAAGQAASSTVEQNYLIENVARQYLQLYRELLT